MTKINGIREIMSTAQ